MSHRIKSKESALKRMDEIAAYYWKQDGVRAITAFGSLAELDRFDEWSDLDFLILCTKESKAQLLNNVSALESLYPISYLRIEYGDAVKLLYEDDILCDFGIVTEEQAMNFPHGKGRLLWSVPDFTCECIRENLMPQEENDITDWKGDILIHLYVGLLRDLRGETAAAFEEIQINAVQKLLLGLYYEKGYKLRDKFSPMRRAEKFAFEFDINLKKLLPGYTHNTEAAGEILKLIKDGEYPQKLAVKVEQLISERSASD
jgi:predicted nucleotidyltransferase